MINTNPTYVAADSYPYECSCGERYNTVDAAYHCRKCRNYCVFGYCTHVVDIRNDKVVRGEVPTAEQWGEATIKAEVRWAEEAASLEFEKERYNQARAEWDTARERERAEMDEDALWELQDRLMK